MKSIRKNYALMGAAFTMGMLASQDANALPAVTATGGTTDADGFNTVFDRIISSFGGLPNLISMFCYLIGLVFIIGGILKIKDHVENPGNTDLKSGAVRLLVGGALLALPTIIDLATATVGDQKQDATVMNLTGARTATF